MEKKGCHYKNMDIAYLELLREQYPDMNAACTEIINLQAILNLPKGTEHFISDIHGEYEAFDHVLKNASGVIKRYIEEIYGTTLRDSEKRSLATLIYYPEQKLQHIYTTEADISDWFRVLLFRLVRVCKRASSKYTRSKVRKSLPKEFAYIIEELLHEDQDRLHKHEYYNEIIDSIIDLGRAPSFIIALSNLIQRFAIDHLHVIGDIYDRGRDAYLVMDRLEKYHSFDIQWGNHDILWMGAASGSVACICNAIRVSARYNNLSTIEHDYGINLVPLVTFAMENYTPENSQLFRPKIIRGEESDLTEKELDLAAMIHKAITIVQFKEEARVIARNPEFYMDERLLLDKIDYAKGEITLDGKNYKLKDSDFPTIDPADPYKLTDDELDMLDKLKYSFSVSHKLQSHAKVLFSKGEMYTISNNCLLYHGCVPLSDDGSLKSVKVGTHEYKGRALLDELETIVRRGFFTEENHPKKQRGRDVMWYLWCGEDSPLYGKNRMATFESYFIADKATHAESKDPYYNNELIEESAKLILADFGLDPDTSHIINGHVPVKVTKGESPIKANGRLIVIDGGFSKAYQGVTGIAGYTLIYNSKGLNLASHQPFTTTKDAVENETDIVSMTAYQESPLASKLVRTTDKGAEITEKINHLKLLVKAYTQGDIKERAVK